MAEHTFRVGDRVAYTNRNGEPVRVVAYGEVGTVVHLPSETSVGVEFDQQVEMGHNCDGHAEESHGWYCNPDHLTYLYENVLQTRPLTEGEIPPRPRMIRPSDNAQSIQDAMREMAEQMRNGAGVGIDLSALRPHSAPLLDDVLSPFQPPYEPENREVKPLKLNELTHGLPLLGLRVMINPEKQDNYHSRYHGKSGIIANLRGNTRDAYHQITRYKRDGNVGAWSCTVKFDDGRETDVRIAHMLPIIPEKEVLLHEVVFDGDRFYWTPEQYEAEVDKYVITYQWQLKKHIVWNDEARQNVLDSH